MRLPEGLIDVFDRRPYAHLATLMPDGAPQVSVVWIERQGDLLSVNSVDGRIKVANMRRSPQVALSITPQDGPFGNWSIRGRVVDITTEGADDQIHRLARRYLGVQRNPWSTPGQLRVTALIEPLSISGHRG